SSRRRHTRFSRDWSSDVCSSDLGEKARADDDVRLAGLQHLEQARDLRRVVLAVAVLADDVVVAARQAEQEPGLHRGADTEVAREIGRASCRERVSTSVAAA